MHEKLSCPVSVSMRQFHSLFYIPACQNKHRIPSWSYQLKLASKPESLMPTRTVWIICPYQKGSQFPLKHQHSLASPLHTMSWSLAESSHPWVFSIKESQGDSLLTLYSGIRFWLKLLMQVSSVITLQKAFKNKTEVGCKATALLRRGGGVRKKIDAFIGRKERASLFKA